MKTASARIAFASLGLSWAAVAEPLTVNLDTLDLGLMSSGWGQAQSNKSVTGVPMAVAGQAFTRGVGTHADSAFLVELDGQAETFRARVGLDDDVGPVDKGSVIFTVMGDGKTLWTSAVVRARQPAQEVQVPLAGVRQLLLLVGDAGDGIDYDHADWAEAAIQFHGQPPQAQAPPKEEAVILTPAAPATPRINGPAVYGVRPGSPFLYRVPCTGERPIHFAAKGLPKGLTLDAQSGVISGAIEDRSHRTHKTQLTARNARGEASRDLCIVVGDTLALTPPMGWNSWYIHYHRVTEAHLRHAADTMIASGMADYGYQYVNIDDCWMKKKGQEPYRGEAGAVLPNEKFPDIKGMVAHIHARGLKAGTYISPGPWTCAGYVGSWQHEAADAKQFADWGFDFLKHDWCSYGNVATGEGREKLIRPYRLMIDELRKQPRDIVFNLCQYGMGNVWEWGASVGHCWRTTGDLGLERGRGLPGFYGIGLSNAKHAENAQPGGWNDPDYILIGWVGDAYGMGEGKQTTLTPNEQYSYMSLWSLMASPLIFSGDMAKLDPFTLNVLCNHEVIAVDQDALGQQGRIVRQTNTELVMVKDLEDGTKAVGLFNLSPAARDMSVAWGDAGVTGSRTVRDLWRQQDVGRFDGSYSVQVPRHGVALVRLTAAKE